MLSTLAKLFGIGKQPEAAVEVEAAPAPVVEEAKPAKITAKKKTTAAKPKAPAKPRQKKTATK